MRKMFIHIIIFTAIFALFPNLGLAKTGYVSDRLLLTFRQGPGNSHKVIKTLKSNTPVSVLDEQEGFYKVELLSKEIGWVDKKFIIFELPKAVIAEKLEKKYKALEAELKKTSSGKQTLNEQISSMQEEYSKKVEDLKISLKKTENENESLKKALTQSNEKYNTLINQSKNIQKVIIENKELKEKNQTLTQAFESLQKKHKNSFGAAMIKWFLAGVGVLLFGWIIGNSVSTKKRRSSLLD